MSQAIFGCGPLELVFWIGFGGLVLPWLAGLAWRLFRHLRDRSYRNRNQRKPRGSTDDQAVDQLEGIEGIGPKISAALNAADISSFDQLADTSVQDLRSIIAQAGPDLATADPMSWPLQAQMLANGDVEGFRQLTNVLQGGVARLEDVWGVGPAIAARLRAGGIASVASLAAAKPSEIVALIPNGYSSAVISQWREQAALLAKGDPIALLAAARMDGRASALNSPIEGADLDRTGDNDQQGRGWYILTERIVDTLTAGRGEPIWFPVKQTSLLAIATMLIALFLGVGASNALLPSALHAMCVSPSPPPSPDCDCKCDGDTVIGPPGAGPSCLFDRTLSADALFSPGDDQLTAEGEANVARSVAAFVGRMANDPSQREFVVFVTGHADRTRFSQAGGNDGLAMRRAEAVRKALLQGPQFSQAPIFAISAGDSEPTGQTEQCSQVNDLAERLACFAPDRRVAIKIISLPQGAVPPAWQQ